MLVEAAADHTVLQVLLAVLAAVVVVAQEDHAQTGRQAQPTEAVVVVVQDQPMPLYSTAEVTAVLA
jgi:hypothetical protein